MKKYFLLFLFAVLAVSCSKKVEITGTMKDALPLERIEFIEASGVGTLPLANIGLDKDGKFKTSFEAPKDGMYVMTYADKQALIYLKKGQLLNIQANALTFPENTVFSGDAKNNNDFLFAVQKNLIDYSQKLQMDQKMALGEAEFVKEMQKIKQDLNKNIDENAKKFKADQQVVDFKRSDIDASLLSITGQYEVFKKQTSNNPAFAAGKVLKDFQNSLQKDKDLMIKDHPVYRSYLLTKMNDEFQTFATAKAAGKTDLLTADLFKEFLVNKKDLSQTAKDYLMSFVITQADLRPEQTPANLAKLKKIIDTDLKDAAVKKDMQNLYFAVAGPKVGDALPQTKVVKADGSSFDLNAVNGKPRLIMFYASWNPGIAAGAVPVLKEVQKFYGKKMDFVAVNLDDSKDQFVKTNTSLLKGIPVTNIYAEGGLDSDLARKFGMYGFKLAPSYLLLDKNGKVAGRLYYNLGEQELITLLDKHTGLKAPTVAQPEIQLQNDLMAQPPVQQGGNAAPQQQPQAQPQQAPAPATK